MVPDKSPTPQVTALIVSQELISSYSVKGKTRWEFRTTTNQDKKVPLKTGGGGKDSIQLLVLLPSTTARWPEVPQSPQDHNDLPVVSAEEAKGFDPTPQCKEPWLAEVDNLSGQQVPEAFSILMFNLSSCILSHFSHM